MPFFDMPAHPLHHGQAIAMVAERVIKPTADEEAQGIEAVGISKGWCREQQCRQRFFYIRNLYPGGWGPVNRMRDSQKIAQVVKRLKEAIESDWVYSWHRETYAKVKYTVR